MTDNCDKNYEWIISKIELELERQRKNERESQREKEREKTDRLERASAGGESEG